jgi:hypothetical protein
MTLSLFRFLILIVIRGLACVAARRSEWMRVMLLPPLVHTIRPEQYTITQTRQNYSVNIGLAAEGIRPSARGWLRVARRASKR